MTCDVPPMPRPALSFGADDGIRTRDPHLGKVMQRIALICPNTQNRRSEYIFE